MSIQIPPLPSIQPNNAPEVMGSPWLLEADNPERLAWDAAEVVNGS